MWLALITCPLCATFHLSKMGTAGPRHRGDSGFNEVILTSGLAQCLHAMGNHKKGLQFSPQYLESSISLVPPAYFPRLSWQLALANKGRKGLRNKPKSPEGSWPTAQLTPICPLPPLASGPRTLSLEAWAPPTSPPQWPLPGWRPKPAAALKQGQIF